MADENVFKGEFTEQELLAQNVRNAQTALNVMKDLDKIKTPLECSIYMAGNKSTYRNQAYRIMVTQMDNETKESLKKFLKENKEVEL